VTWPNRQIKRKPAMNDQSRLFDFLYQQLQHFPKPDMLAGKVNGSYTTISTQTVVDQVNKLSAALLNMGLSGGNMDVEVQDKIAIISKNRPEWLVLDLACQQIGVVLCPIYPTTNINEMEYIFNDAAVKYVFITGEDILDKVNNIRNQVPSLLGVFSFDEMQGADNWEKLLHQISNEQLEAVDVAKKAIMAKDEGFTISAEGSIKWFKLDVQIELLELDTITGDFAKKITYRVVPYLVHQSIFANPNSAPVGYGELMKKVVKEYSYIYTGQNVDVLKFDININNLFYSAVKPSSESKGSTTSNQDQKASEKLNKDRKSVV
jgi:hypothetical protein